MAEENLRDFTSSSKQKGWFLNIFKDFLIKYMILEAEFKTKIYSPQRIELPIYFNTPRRVEKVEFKNQMIGSNSRYLVIQTLYSENTLIYAI